MDFMNILVAFAAVGGIALILGILLAVISKFFSVPENETVKAIRGCLPGVNCGACGYKGCDDYAAAVAEGTAKPNLCVPGAEATAKELGEILGVEVEAPVDLVAYVHCNGNCEATSKKAAYDGISSCKAASMLYGGPDTCRFGCLGLGDCAKACPANAICLKDGIAHVDTSRCLGCGLCATICPKHIIHKQIAVVCSHFGVIYHSCQRTLFEGRRGVAIAVEILAPEGKKQLARAHLSAIGLHTLRPQKQVV